MSRTKVDRLGRTVEKLYHRVGPFFGHLIDDVDAAALQFYIGKVGTHLRGQLGVFVDLIACVGKDQGRDLRPS